MLHLVFCRHFTKIFTPFYHVVNYQLVSIMPYYSHLFSSYSSSGLSISWWILGIPKTKNKCKKEKRTTYVEDFTTDRDIDCRLVFIVVGKQIRISSKQKLQAEPVTVLWAKMTRSIAVDIFGVNVCTVLNQSLYHTQITSETGDVQRCTEIVRSSINLRPEFNEDLD